MHAATIIIVIGQPYPVKMHCCILARINDIAPKKATRAIAIGCMRCKIPGWQSAEPFRIGDGNLGRWKGVRGTV
jgi:hypothetical protein